MKECHYIRKSTFLCVMVFCASGLATCSSANLIESSNETRAATITDSQDPVEMLGATITDFKEQVAQKVWEPDDDDRWDVLVIGCVWKNGQKIFEARRTDLSDVVILRRRVVVQ